MAKKKKKRETVLYPKAKTTWFASGDIKRMEKCSFKNHGNLQKLMFFSWRYPRGHTRKYINVVLSRFEFSQEKLILSMKNEGKKARKLSWKFGLGNRLCDFESFSTGRKTRTS